MSQEASRAQTPTSIRVGTILSLLLALAAFVFFALDRIVLRYPDSFADPLASFLPAQAAVVGGGIALLGLLIAVAVTVRAVGRARLALYSAGLCSAAIIAGILLAI